MRLEERRLPLLMHGPEDVPFLSFRAVALSAVFPPYLSHLSRAAPAGGLFRCSFRSLGTADKTGTSFSSFTVFVSHKRLVVNLLLFLCLISA
ncbi:hypothetical protein [Prevotella denticola]|uniref:hypothetical protein n=1 Tax=Prevotella denticola TaxID=28129 RepID=UPI00241D0387|nr:hypothetical protein [Prevotella denticola]